MHTYFVLTLFSGQSKPKVRPVIDQPNTIAEHEEVRPQLCVKYAFDKYTNFVIASMFCQG